MRFNHWFILFILLIGKLTAQSQDLRFNALSTEDGLSNNLVVCILQDKQGYMWFGTEDGLNRYDGNSFTVFRHNPDDPNSLVSNNISSILQDSAGLIWVGTKGGGLNCFDPRSESFRYYLHDPDDPGSLCSNEVLSIFQDRNMDIWIGTDGGGISRYLRTEDCFENYSSNSTSIAGLAGNEILSIREDPEGNMWFGTWDKGLYCLATDKQSFEPIPLSSGRESRHITENIWSMYPDRSGHLWVGMWGGGFGRFDIAERKYEPLLFNSTNEVGGENNVWSVYQDQEGKVWIGTDRGLFRYSSGSGEFEHIEYEEDRVEGISSNKVLCIYEDRTRAIWIGTDKGINVFFPYRKKFINLQAAATDGTYLSKDIVTAVTEDEKGAIWIGTEELGLYKYLESTGKLVHFRNSNSLENDLACGRINRLFIDSGNKLWMGTRYGLWSYDENRDLFKQYYINPERKSSTNEVMDICEISGSMLWVGTDDGLYQFNKRTGEFLDYYGNNQDTLKLNSNHILSLSTDRSGNLWVGSWKGIDMISTDGTRHEKFQHDFQDPGSLVNNYVNAIFQDREGRMWFGTKGGLCRLDPGNGRFLNYREKDGLPNDVINGILEDDHHNLWLSTNKGLSRFSRDSSRFDNFDQYDGIQGTQFSTGACFKSHSGTMYFGGINGLCLFNPDSIFLNRIIPDVWITGLNIRSEHMGIGTEGSPLETHISYTENIVLSYKQKDLSLDFVALNYLSPNRNQYAYKLEGLDDKHEGWIYVGNRRTAYFTNIPPGEYTFRVMASNNDNRWNESGASLGIIIEPPFWKTDWFTILIIVSIYAIVYALFRLRTARIKMQNRLLEAQVEERTREVVRQKEDLAVQAENLSKANHSIISKNLQLEESAEKIRIQAEEIFRMNELLKWKNINLEENVHELEMARVMQKRVSFTEFKQIYPDIDSCRKFLFELKEEKGYHCMKCGGTHYTVNSLNYSRRCTRCGYNESVTVNTIFYRIKFPIDKAFYILYLVSMGRELTVDELSGLITLRRETCWAFRNKVMEVMKKHKRFKNPREGWKELILNSA